MTVKEFERHLNGSTRLCCRLSRQWKWRAIKSIKVVLSCRNYYKRTEYQWELRPLWNGSYYCSSTIVSKCCRTLSLSLTVSWNDYAIVMQHGDCSCCSRGHYSLRSTSIYSSRLCYFISVKTSRSLLSPFSDNFFPWKVLKRIFLLFVIEWEFSIMVCSNTDSCKSWSLSWSLSAVWKAWGLRYSH